MCCWNNISSSLSNIQYQSDSISFITVYWSVKVTDYPFKLKLATGRPLIKIKNNIKMVVHQAACVAGYKYVHYI